ncbi:MAG: hypothetical protein HYY12_06485 [Candidatus Methylomirabilis oxyfera]|nr:hypothetical protein [Candidatus Methylomirabilis oxyfera]
MSALRGRRSRRFGLGMKMETGPLAYQSNRAPLPLMEAEEAALAFAACGLTGYALADLLYDRGQGGTIMAGLLGRTVSSGDAIQTVSLVVSNDQATYLLKRPQDFQPADIPELIQLAMQGGFTELYRRSRITIKDGRAALPSEPMFNLDVNRWSVPAPGSTYFVPINELCYLYINALLEIFNETTGAFILDERANFRPAGIGRFARRKGGHLLDDPKGGRVGTIQRVELLVAEMVTIEQGMILQNLGLMTQAMGLGGFPNFAAHEFGWFQALGFRMGEMRASRYLGMNRLISAALGLLGRDQPVPYPLGLDRDGVSLLKAYCPPYYPSMEAAVRAVVDRKFGSQGVFRGGATGSAWRHPTDVSAAIPGLSDAAIDATIAYCEYIHDRYGRFPAYVAPFRTVLGFQVAHLDVEFYDRFYRSEALTETQRRHLSDYHDIGES